VSADDPAASLCAHDMLCCGKCVSVFAVCQFEAWSLILPYCVPMMSHLSWRKRRHQTLCCCFLTASSQQKRSVTRQLSTDRSVRHSARYLYP